MDRILENISKKLNETTLNGKPSEEGCPASHRKKREDMCFISEDVVLPHEVDDAHMLEINKRLNRVVMILKVQTCLCGTSVL